MDLQWEASDYWMNKWTLDEIRRMAQGRLMEADKVSGVVENTKYTYDANGNITGTIAEDREKKRGTASGTLCGRTFLCNCNAVRWSVPLQKWICQGCYDDHERLWGKK